MSFGRNPHVAKAEAAEQKALDARDGLAREQAFRDAARQWERAAERENDAKRKKLYGDKAEQARANADSAQAGDAAGDESEDAEAPAPEAAVDPGAKPHRLLN